MKFSKPRLTRRIFGTIIRADAYLANARSDLRDDYFVLKVFLDERGSRMKNQAFVDRMRLRYDENHRSYFYLFASLEAQRSYDREWHKLGFLIKEYQSRGLIGRSVEVINETV